MSFRRPCYFQGQQITVAPLRKTQAHTMQNCEGIKHNRNSVRIARGDRKEDIRPNRNSVRITSSERKGSASAMLRTSPRRQFKGSASPLLRINPRTQLRRSPSPPLRTIPRRPYTRPTKALKVEGPRIQDPKRREKWFEVATGLEVKKMLWIEDSTTTDSSSDKVPYSDYWHRSPLRSLHHRSAERFQEESSSSSDCQHIPYPKNISPNNWKTIRSPAMDRPGRCPVAVRRFQQPRSYYSRSYSPSMAESMSINESEDYLHEPMGCDSNSSGYDSIVRRRNAKLDMDYYDTNRHIRSDHHHSPIYHPERRHSPNYHPVPYRKHQTTSRPRHREHKPAYVPRPVSVARRCSPEPVYAPRPRSAACRGSPDPCGVCKPERCRPAERNRIVDARESNCESSDDSSSTGSDSREKHKGYGHQHRNMYRSPHKHQNLFDQWLAHAAERTFSPMPINGRNSALIRNGGYTNTRRRQFRN